MNKSGLWRIALPESEEDLPQQLVSLLGSAEQARFQRIKNPARRIAFTVGRALARAAYCHCYGGELSQVTLTQDELGRPSVVSGRSFDFSISHSGKWVLCGFSIHGRVGVDIESLARKRDWQGIAQHYFHDDEIHLIQSDTNPEHCFYQLWVLKEALLKMLGIGLRVPLQQVRFNKQKSGWHYCGDLAAEAETLSVMSLDGYMLAVVAEQPMTGGKLQQLSLEFLLGNDIIADHGTK